MERAREVASSDGLKLHVRERGKPDGIPILLIHGWSQNHLSWARQYEGPLADEFRIAAMDIRGHGMSDKPLDATSYTDGRLWADDVAAVIDQFDLDRPVLVGWSYAGFIVSDYLRSYGDSVISGVNLAGAVVTLNEAAFGTFIGPVFIDHVEGATSPDLPTNIETMCGFVAGCVAEPMPPDDFARALAYNVVVPPEVRAGLIARTIDSDDVLASLTVPVLVSHGREDRVILPGMAEHILDVCPPAAASWYANVGHMPFLEAAERFNEELAAFCRRVR